MAEHKYRRCLAIAQSQVSILASLAFTQKNKGNVGLMFISVKGKKPQ